MGVFPVSATHHAARTPPTPAESLKLNAGASRRRRPPPRSCSPAPIPRRNDARRDALSGETPPPKDPPGRLLFSCPRTTSPSGLSTPSSRTPSFCAEGTLAQGGGGGRESSTGKLSSAVELRGARAPLFHWYVRRRLPFDGQLRQNVVETDVRSTRPVMLP